MGIRRMFRRPPGRGDEAAARGEVDDELAFHLAEAEAELVAEGMDPEAARVEARRRFGDVEATRAYCTVQQARRHRREARRGGMGGIRSDMVQAVRALRKAPGYTTVVLLTLAVGIAAGTVVFSVLNPFFLRPLPYDDPGRLVQLGLVDPRYGWDGGRFSLEMLQDFRDGTESFEAMGAYHYGSVNLTGPEGSVRTQVSWLTPALFQVLGVTAAVGRTFSTEDPPEARVAVLSDGLWRRRWGADPQVVGRGVEVDGVLHTVLGIMPPDFNFPFGEVELWIPVAESPATEARDHTAHIVVGRLADGVPSERAREELQALQASLARAHPDVDGVYDGVSLTPIREALNFAWDELRLALGVLLAAVVLVLGIACVNVAGLTLARASARGREVAVRTAIGASRGRIVRHLLLESLVLALAGGALGVGLAYLATGVVDPLLPDGLFRVGGATVDRRVLLFSAGVTLVTPLLFGLLPALRISGTPPARALRRTDGGGRGALRGRQALVAAELALAVVLVTGTGLMLRSVMELGRTDLGYDPERLLTLEVTLPAGEYPSGAARDAFFTEAATALAARPGIEGVAQVNPLPMNHENIPVEVARTGAEPSGDEPWPTSLLSRAGPGYFDVMDIPLLAGRPITSGAGEGVPEVVISLGVARDLFGTDDPVGRSITFGEDRTVGTVVGVVGDIYHSGYEARRPDRNVYLDIEARAQRRRFLVARTRNAPAGLMAGARQSMLELDPDLPVAVRPMTDVLLESTFQWSVSSLVLAVFGLVALALAGMGIYGLTAYAVARRRRELGVRMALGAGAGRIRWMLVGEGARLAVIGGLVGLGGSLLLGRLASGFLYQVPWWDPATLGGVVLVFGLLVLVASFLPARRATRADPVKALRQE